MARIPPHSQLQSQVDEDQCLSAQTMAECCGTCEAGSRLDPRVTRKRACVWDSGFWCDGTFAVGCGWCWLCMKQVGADARGHVQGWQGGEPVLFLAPDAVIHRAAGCLLPSKKVSRVCRHQRTSSAPGGLGAGFIEPGDPAHHGTTLCSDLPRIRRSACHPARLPSKRVVLCLSQMKDDDGGRDNREQYESHLSHARGVQHVKVDLRRPLVGIMRSLIAFVLPAQPAADGVCERHTGLDVSSNCTPRRHGTVSCNYVGFYAAMPHELAPDDHQAAFPVSGVPDSWPVVL